MHRSLQTVGRHITHTGANRQRWLPKVAPPKKNPPTAQQHGVPIHHDPALVGALSSLDLGEQIPTELFSAVATVSAFIYR
jgi:hypothetical protein